MRRMHRLTQSLALGLVVGALLVACGGDGDDEGAPATTQPATGTTEAGPPEQTKIRVGLLPAIGVAPFYVAEQRGLFKAEGLEDVSPTVAVTGVTEALIGGEYDIVYAAYVVPFQALGQDLPVMIVAEGDRVPPGGSGGDPEAPGVVVLPDSTIRGPRDLEGKAIGVPTVAIGQVFLFPALERRGVDTDKVKLVELFFPAMVQSLAQGDVDAIFAPEPLNTQARRELDVRKVFDAFEDTTEHFPIAGYFTTESFVEKNPNTVRAFRRAIEKASGLINEDWRVAATVLPSYMGLSAEVANELSPATFGTQIDPDGLQRIADTMRRLGLLPKQLDVAEAIAQ
jgi:NitT/TauT family transport system substrate-binding protein